MWSRNFKKLVAAGCTLGIIGTVGGVTYVLNCGNKQENNYQDKSVTYELPSNKIENSILGGCQLDQYTLGSDMQLISGDGTGDSTWSYSDKNGSIDVFGNKDKINEIEQVIKYDEKTWQDVLSFWEKLNRKDRMYIGTEDVDYENLDWEDPKNDIQLTGWIGNCSYEFRRYNNCEMELMDGGGTVGFNGLAISINVTRNGGDDDE